LARPANSAGDDTYGVFANFPDLRHGTASIRTDATRYQAQKALAEALSQLRSEKRSAKISVANHPGPVDGQITFELGIASGDEFVFFNDDEKKRLLERIDDEGPFRALDVFLIVRYSVPGLKKAPWLDRYMVRMEFSDMAMDVVVVHEKGLQRIDAEGIIRLLVEGLSKVLGRELQIISLRAA